MQMNDENIQTEEIKQAAEPEFKFPDDAESTSRPNETAEVVTRETAEETNTELLQSIDKNSDLSFLENQCVLNRFPVCRCSGAWSDCCHLFNLLCPVIMEYITQSRFCVRFAVCFQYRGIILLIVGRSAFLRRNQRPHLPV